MGNQPGGMTEFLAALGLMYSLWVVTVEVGS